MATTESTILMPHTAFLDEARLAEIPGAVSAIKQCGPGECHGRSAPARVLPQIGSGAILDAEAAWGAGMVLTAGYCLHLSLYQEQGVPQRAH
jgi:hypothetical protein